MKGSCITINTLNMELSNSCISYPRCSGSIHHYIEVHRRNSVKTKDFCFNHSLCISLCPPNRIGTTSYIFHMSYLKLHRNLKGKKIDSFLGVNSYHCLSMINNCTGFSIVNKGISILSIFRTPCPHNNHQYNQGHMTNLKEIYLKSTNHMNCKLQHQSYK